MGIAILSDVHVMIDLSLPVNGGYTHNQFHNIVEKAKMDITRNEAEALNLFKRKCGIQREQKTPDNI